MKTLLKLFGKTFPLCCGLIWAGAGCVTTEEIGPPPASQADVGYLREELRRMHDRLDAAEYQFGQLQGDVRTSQANQPAYATASQIQSLQSQLENLQSQIRALDAARTQDKKDIYDDITKKVASLIKASQPAGGKSSAARATSGWEHVVQPGESLSKIAAAYKVKMSAIVEANGLKSVDAPILIGQKLFIPD